jgi:hypothetical protein
MASIDLIVFIPALIIIDLVVKLFGGIDAKPEWYNINQSQTRDQVAWRIIAWIVPFSWALLGIRHFLKGLKKLFGFWKNLPPL